MLKSARIVRNMNDFFASSAFSSLRLCVKPSYLPLNANCIITKLRLVLLRIRFCNTIRPVPETCLNSASPK